MRDLIEEKTNQILNKTFEEDPYNHLFPKTLEEQKEEYDRLQKENLQPENIGKGILYRACLHAGVDLKLNSDYMYDRIKNQKGIDWV